MSPVPMAKGFLSEELTCPMDTLIEPKRRMCVLHPKGNGILYLHLNSSMPIRFRPIYDWHHNL